MITRKINIDRTTYDLDITTNTIIQNDTQYSYFSKIIHENSKKYKNSN